MDKVVIDIETKNTFSDVGGKQFLNKLDVSFVGVYSYSKDAYFSFFENQMKELDDFLRQAGLVIGFSINRFDVPILNKYLTFDLFSVPRVDILDEIEMKIGRRISLDILAHTNVGFGKTSHGLEAVRFYREGLLKELESYCLNDVKVTKEVYDLARRQKYLLVPDRITGNNEKVELDFYEGEMIMKQSLF